VKEKSSQNRAGEPLENGMFQAAGTLLPCRAYACVYPFSLRLRVLIAMYDASDGGWSEVEHKHSPSPHEG
jgi:hypothetical protein